tara:strand:+ start:454 stop:792 length:339 start_codon:yes stop_codon:yes gene_type:complete
LFLNIKFEFVVAEVSNKTRIDIGIKQQTRQSAGKRSTRERGKKKEQSGKPTKSARLKPANERENGPCRRMELDLPRASQEAHGTGRQYVQRHVSTAKPSSSQAGKSAQREHG